MKNIRIHCCLIVFALSPLCTKSQGFVNLDFEHPILPFNPVNFHVPISSALPGWVGYYASVSFGTNIVSQILYNAVSTGAAAISLHDTFDQEDLPIAGEYSVFLQSSSPSGQYSSSIGQTGQIPVNTQSLTFLVRPTYLLQVSFGGQIIPLFVIGTMGGNDILGGDISAFAGQTGELLFTAPYLGGGMIDNIQFSSSPVPEPSPFALSVLAFSALGGLLSARYRRS